MLKPTIFLNENEIEFYHRHGYLALSAITTPEEICRLREVSFSE